MNAFAQGLAVFSIFLALIALGLAFWAAFLLRRSEQHISEAEKYLQKANDELRRLENEA